MIHDNIEDFKSMLETADSEYFKMEGPEGWMVFKTAGKTNLHLLASNRVFPAKGDTWQVDYVWHYCGVKREGSILADFRRRKTLVTLNLVSCKTQQALMSMKKTVTVSNGTVPHLKMRELDFEDLALYVSGRNTRKMSEELKRP